MYVYFPPEPVLFTVEDFHWWPIFNLCSFTADRGWRHDRYSLLHEPSFPYVVLALYVVYLTTLCRFVCLVLRVYQQGPQGVDGFVIHWYIIGFENPCKLFRHITNIAWHVVFCWFLCCLHSLCFS